MIKTTCSISKCYNDPDYICSCEGNEVNICKDHLSLHMFKEVNYNVKKNFIGLSPDDKEILTAHCESSLKKLKTVREHVSNKARECINKILENLKVDLETIREKYMMILEVMEYLKQKDRVLLKKDNSKCEKFIIKSVKNPLEFNEKLKKKELEMIKEFDFEIKENILQTKIYKLNETVLNVDYKFSKLCGLIGFDYEKEINNEVKDEKNMYYFKNSSHDLVIIDVFEEKDTQKSFKVYEDMSCYSNICKIDNQRLFYYSGYNNFYYLDSTYIFNVHENVFDKKTSWKKNGYGGISSLYKDHVYLFGGCHYVYQSQSYKYRIASIIGNK